MVISAENLEEILVNQYGAELKEELVLNHLAVGGQDTKHSEVLGADLFGLELLGVELSQDLSEVLLLVQLEVVVHDSKALQPDDKL